MCQAAKIVVKSKGEKSNFESVKLSPGEIGNKKLLEYQYIRKFRIACITCVTPPQFSRPAPLIFYPDFIKADLIAVGLSPFRPESAALRAGRLLREEIHEKVRHGKASPSRIFERMNEKALGVCSRAFSINWSELGFEPSTHCSRSRRSCATVHMARARGHGCHQTALSSAL